MSLQEKPAGVARNVAPFCISALFGGWFGGREDGSAETVGRGTVGAGNQVAISIDLDRVVPQRT